MAQKEIYWNNAARAQRHAHASRNNAVWQGIAFLLACERPRRTHLRRLNMVRAACAVSRSEDISFVSADRRASAPLAPPPPLACLPTLLLLPQARTPASLRAGLLSALNGCAAGAEAKDGFEANMEAPAEARGGECPARIRAAMWSSESGVKDVDRGLLARACQIFGW